jgi:glyoxylase-like metal-dependent hydrolase (beta-lactamase superfamily II)
MGPGTAAWPFSEIPPGVDDRVRRFRLGDEVDTFVVRTERLLVVVDTMSTPADGRLLREAIAGDRSGRSLVVVDTHADYDHAWGNSVFADVPIIGHARCGARLRGAEAAADIARWSAVMPGRFDDVVATPPSILFGDEGLVLDGGDLTIELIPTPGHSDDHVSLYLREPGILLAGDAAEVPFPHVDTADGLVQARASLERLVALGASHVLPCHGGTTDPVVLVRNIAWLDAVVADPGLSFEDAVARFGDGRAEVSDLYRTFHAAACGAAARAGEGLAVPDGACAGSS